MLGTSVPTGRGMVKVATCMVPNGAAENRPVETGAVSIGRVSKVVRS